MRNSFSIADDLIFAALFAIAIAVITFAMVATDDAHPLVSSTDIVVTEPSKVDGDITPSSSTPPPQLYATDSNTADRW